MTTRFFTVSAAIGLLLVVGWGCTKNPLPTSPMNGGGDAPDTEVLGASDIIPDGKGPAPFELCVTTDGAVSGPVWLYAANNTSPRTDWSQWFSAKPVAAGDAAKEMCGGLNFDLKTGDQIFINGAWSNGKKYLVTNTSAGGADSIKEIWIDDRYYEVGKDCGYESNGKGGYNVVCTVR